MKEKKCCKKIEERLGGTVPTPPPVALPTGLPALGYPHEYLGCSPVSSPAISPTAMPTIPGIDNTTLSMASSLSTDPLCMGMGLYGRIPNPVSLSVGPTSPQAATTFPGQYPVPSLGGYPVSMVPSPYGHALMGAAIL